MNTPTGTTSAACFYICTSNRSCDLTRQVPGDGPLSVQRLRGKVLTVQGTRPPRAMWSHTLCARVVVSSRSLQRLLLTVSRRQFPSRPLAEEDESSSFTLFCHNEGGDRSLCRAHLVKIENRYDTINEANYFYSSRGTYKITPE